MPNSGEQTALTQKIYEFIKARGCATIEEIAQAVNTSPRRAYLAIRSLITRRLVLPYKFQVGRERMFCIPDVGDRLYGHNARSSKHGMICITLPIDMIETIDKIAKSTGESRSSVIRQALTYLIDSYNGRNGQNGQPEHKQQKSPEDEELDLVVPDR